MKEKVMDFINKLKDFWQGKNRRQKIILLSSIAAVIIVLSALIFFTARTTMVPLYTDLTPAETGRIKEVLDEKGIQSEISDNGTTIKVPQEHVDTLLVELAAQGIPESGSIDYSFFSENAGLGMTDNEFDVMKLDAMQTELANLIKRIDGIKDAKVMINLPEKGIFVQDETEEASASIVLTTEPGYNFSDSQIQALYRLVSKSVPNLPTDNIVIMDQNFQYYDLENGKKVGNDHGFDSQYAIKKEIERDIQREVQRMLGTLMGQDKVVVSVSADIDFTREKREENLVEPVDEENMEGIAVSAQRISESYTGEALEGGVPQAEDEGDTLTGYAEGATGEGEYESTEEMINYEVNRIRKEIVESPYKIRDLGIQVIVEPPNPESPYAVSAEVEEGIQDILSTIIRTTIDDSGDDEELTDSDIEDKIAVTFQPLLGNAEEDSSPENTFPVWGYILIGLLTAAIATFVIILIRKRRENHPVEQVQDLTVEKTPEPPVDIPDVNEAKVTEETLKQKQIEKLAKEKPDEFAKLLRSWLSQD